MENQIGSDNDDFIEQHISIQMITFGIIMIVTILTFVSFIHIYSSKKEQVLKDMQTESTQLKIIIADNLNYSKYFIDIIGRHIQNDYKNLDHISKTLKDHFNSEDFNMLFGWRKYSWIDSNFFEIVSSSKGIIPNPKRIDYIKNYIENISVDNKGDKIIFHNNKEFMNNSLKIIDNIFDKETKEYIGSVILSYDIKTLVRSLNLRKKNKNTNFLILDKNLESVAQSEPIIENLINKDSDLVEHLNLALRGKSHDSLDDISYLDMVNGLNYLVTSFPDLPFKLIINMDSDIIHAEIISDILKSFTLVCIFASISLFVIIFIYKRETFLRTKAERASVIAEKATRAKTNFLAFTAHEIRSPLGFILTGSEIIIKKLFGELSPQYIEYAQGIHENSKVILDFITDILDESQIIQGKFKIVNAVHDINEIINESIRINLARFNKRKVAINLHTKENLPKLVCDKRRLLQILNNLISNSIKYSNDHTAINIDVEIETDSMIITLTDEGFGMKEEDIPLALNAYGTLRNHEDYCSTGSYGLGLAIVKMLLEAHDAELKINSVEMEGTTVKMIFPKYKLIYGSYRNPDNG